MTLAYPDITPTQANAAAIRRRLYNPPNPKPDHGINIKNGKPEKVEPLPRPALPEPEPLPADVIDLDLHKLIRKAQAIEDVFLGNEPIAQLKRDEHTPSLYAIQCTVANFYDLRQADLVGPKRQARIVRPRQIAIFIAHQITTRSTTYLGHRFGGRDHSTVIHAIKKIARLRESSERLRGEIQLLTKLIYERCGIEPQRDGE